jgi:hypothetical protein
LTFEVKRFFTRFLLIQFSHFIKVKVGQCSDRPVTTVVLHFYLTECATTNGTFTAVADADLIGLEANASFTADADDALIGKLGYIGEQRYVKASCVSANTTTGALYGIIAVLGDPFVQPTAYTAQT